MLKLSMSRSRRTGTTTAIRITALALVGAATTAGAATTTAAATAGSTGTPPISAASSTRHMTPAVGVHPHVIRAGNPENSGDAQVKFGCQQTTPAGCYGPDQIRAAYGIQPLLDKGITGKGRTIVIIDAYAPRNVAEELTTFTTTWGLPKADFELINPFGAGYDETDVTQASWSSEIALDVEWAHVVAPDAKLRLVVAKTSQDADIEDALEYVVAHRLGDVVSQSYGEDERCMDPALLRRQHSTYERGTQRGITFIASSGDQGSAQPTCDGNSYSLAVSSPASDPLDLAVGGTTLVADGTTGAYQSESVWNESATFEAAGGGGFSVLVPKPWYQRGVVPGRFRGVPDVAYSAAIIPGVLGYWDQTPSSVGNGNWYRFGGTSAGSPQWAGITALSAQVAHHSLGLLNDSIYAAARYRSVQDYLFHDITTGTNAFTYTDADGNSVTIDGYAAKPGWDAATGFGSPKADHLVPFLALTNR